MKKIKLYELVEGKDKPEKMKDSDGNEKEKRGRDLVPGDIFVDDIQVSPGQNRKSFMHVEEVKNLDSGGRIIKVKEMYPVD